METLLNITEQVKKNKSSSVESVQLKTKMLHQSWNCIYRLALDFLSLIKVHRQPPEVGLHGKTAVT